MAYVKKRREDCTILLDEGFSAKSVAARLTAAGFRIERFHDWFKDDAGETRRSVPDPEVIQFCHRKGWLLLTSDHEMRNLHRQEISKTDVAILTTAHNSAADIEDWIEALISLQSRLLREFKNRERPWFATFSREAKITSIVTLKSVSKVGGR